MSVPVSVWHGQGTGAGIGVSTVRAAIRWECRCQYGPGRGPVPVAVSVPVSVWYEQGTGHSSAAPAATHGTGPRCHSGSRPVPVVVSPFPQVRGRPNSPLPAHGTGCGSGTDEAAGPSSSPGQRDPRHPLRAAGPPPSSRAAGPSPSPEATGASPFSQDSRTITTPKGGGTLNVPPGQRDPRYVQG